MSLILLKVNNKDAFLYHYHHYKMFNMCVFNMFWGNYDMKATK